MDKIDRMLKTLDPTYLTDSDKEAKNFARAMDQALSGAIGPLERALKATEKMLSEQAKKNQGPNQILEATGAMVEVQNAIKGLLKALPQALASAIPEAVDYTDAFELVLTEIRAIPQPKDVVIPKAERVDLAPVLEAIRRIDVSPQVIMPQEERKTHWTFDVVRNRTTGLIETIEAR